MVPDGAVFLSSLPDMPAEPAISARNLSKSYRLWSHPSARLKSPLLAAGAQLFPADSGPRLRLQRAAATGYRDFHALQPLGFDIRRGEAVGIIGRNGSGKSTLLQLIAGILQPTTGTLASHGRISALLELGSGFNPEFTGRENVYLNGSILGLGAREMDTRIERIIAFADIGEFIDEPVKTYSSGMMMRLAFAVAVSVQPDILIIDEALSVGDVFFTQKCFERIREILAAGATLIFVSHDTAAVQNLCTRGLLLHQGRLVHDGPPDECVNRYFALTVPSSSATAAPVLQPGGLHPPVAGAARAELLRHDIIPAARSRIGDRVLELVAADFINERGDHAYQVTMMQTAIIRLLLRANQPVADPAVGLQVFDHMANLVFAAGTPQRHFNLPSLAAGEEVLLEFRLTCALRPGEYTLGLDAASRVPTQANAGNFHDRVMGLGPLVVHYEQSEVLPFYGIAQLPLQITYG